MKRTCSGIHLADSVPSKRGILMLYCTSVRSTEALSKLIASFKFKMPMIFFLMITFILSL